MKRLIIVFIALIFSVSAEATTYYIDATSGIDTNDGLTKTTALKWCPGMIGFGGTITLVPNDVVVFKGGEIWNIPVQSSGRHWTVYPGVIYTIDDTWYTGSEFHQPQMKTTDIIAGDNTYFIVATNCDNMVFDNLYIGPTGDDEPGSGVRNGGKMFTVSGGTNLEIKNCTFNPWSHHGIIYQSNGVVADSHNIHHNTFMNVSNSIEGAYASGIINLDIHDNTFGPLHGKVVNDHVDGIQFWNHEADNRQLHGKIRNNHFTDDWSANDINNARALNGAIFIENGDTSDVDLLIYNNVFDMTFHGGTNAPGDIDVSSYIFVGEGVKIYNNTLIAEQGEVYASFLRISNATYAYIKNNVFYAAGYKIYWQNVKFDTIAEIDYNTIYNYGTYIASWEDKNLHDLAWWQGRGYDVHSQLTDPALDTNHRPSSNSNVVDNGTTLTDVPDDKDGVVRPKGNGYDIGAYEYDTGNPPGQGLQHPWQEVDQMTTDVKDRIPIDTTRFAPPGGTTGQVLTKLSDADYDVAWQNLPIGGGCDPANDYVGGSKGPYNAYANTSAGVARIVLSTPTCSGDTVELSFSSASTTGVIRILISSDDGDDIPGVGDLLVESAQLTITATGELRVTAAGSAIDENTKYWVGAVTGGGDTVGYGHAGGGATGYYHTGVADWYDTPPANLGSGWNADSSGYSYMIYGTLQ